MTINERIKLLEDMIQENPKALAIAIPVDSLQVILDRCKDREDLKKSETRWRTRSKWYEEAYRTTKAQLKRLNRERRNVS